MRACNRCTEHKLYVCSICRTEDKCAKCGGERRRWIHCNPIVEANGDHEFVEPASPQQERIVRVEQHRAAAQQKSIYVIGSLRKDRAFGLGNELRAQGFDAFDDWYAAGPEADDKWREYEQARGRTFTEALKGEAARHVFNFDKAHIERCDVGVLVLPAGKSGHLELGYLLGRGKPGYILLDGEPDRWDVMYNFASGVFTDVAALVGELKK